MPFRDSSRPSWPPVPGCMLFEGLLSLNRSLRPVHSYSRDCRGVRSWKDTFRQPMAVPDRQPPLSQMRLRSSRQHGSMPGVRNADPCRRIGLTIQDRTSQWRDDRKLLVPFIAKCGMYGVPRQVIHGPGKMHTCADGCLTSRLPHRFFCLWLSRVHMAGVIAVE